MSQSTPGTATLPSQHTAAGITRLNGLPHTALRWIHRGNTESQSRCFKTAESTAVPGNHAHARRTMVIRNDSACHWEASVAVEITLLSWNRRCAADSALQKSAVFCGTWRTDTYILKFDHAHSRVCARSVSQRGVGLSPDLVQARGDRAAPSTDSIRTAQCGLLATVTCPLATAPTVPRCAGRTHGPPCRLACLEHLSPSAGLARAALVLRWPVSGRHQIQDSSTQRATVDQFCSIVVDHKTCESGGRGYGGGSARLYPSGAAPCGSSCPQPQGAPW